MDINQYRNFITIAECGTITAAAAKIMIAQPALSNQLKNLEREFGAKLIQTHRGSRQLALTEAGKLLLQQAQYICSLDAATHQKITDCVKGMTGTLTISISPSRSFFLVRNILKKFHAAYPEVKYRLYEGTTTEQAEHLLNGLSELSLPNAPMQDTTLFDILFTRKEQLMVVYPASGGWLPADLHELKLQELEHLPLCLSSGWYPILRKAFADKNIAANIVSVSTNRQTVLNWALAGLGVAIIPIVANEVLETQLCCVPLNDKKLYTYKTICKVKNKPLSAVAQKFLDCYEQNCYPGTKKGNC